MFRKVENQPQVNKPNTASREKDLTLSSLENSIPVYDPLVFWIGLAWRRNYTKQ